MSIIEPIIALASGLCLAVATATAGEPRRVFIAGDSTASVYPAERAPREGWGMRLQPLLADGWEVRNHAQSGRSARSFIEQGWLDAIAKDLRRGDVLLVQFGHNDAKVEDPARYTDPAVAYPAWLQRYVALARERGATPVLVTPVARRKFDGGQLLDTHGPYPQAMRELAGREGVALVDLNALSMDWLRGLGDAASKPYFLHVPAQRQADDTHFSAAGAQVVACLVAAGWHAADTDAPVRPVTAGTCPMIAAPAPVAVSPSIVVQERDIAVIQPGPHAGEGTTTAYPFFSDATGFNLVFRKRALHPGATIGAHVNDKDEIYYVISGRGELVLNGDAREVGPGDAILTRNGDSHALRQLGDEDLVIFIVFDEASRTP
ncbi:cupin domain-containing protein [Luteimonas viscosa]|uniref:Cupin domain-containing protein n=1 Tax=Luteimonas viscosa TaxID=1132694 RepID=A0A5D4XT87_9GAMM|nr:GDSL-type esterase/lipase family protein [Luteimonas viscosa]TYT25980.1 cupin domain-containing protein [Luteimonas viscosa]